LNSVQSSLAPHLVDALKDAVVQELAAQRRELLAAQQTASAELAELVKRLETVQTPMLERLRTYESRIAELEKRPRRPVEGEPRAIEVENWILLKEQVETERAANRINFMKIRPSPSSPA